MGSTVGTRPNHYELLGLAPNASRKEIDEAFAQAMRRPHLMTEVAQIGVAFDTLRSASKRRAYDEALGLRRESEPRPAPPPAMSFRVSARLAAIASAEPLAPPSLPPTAPVAAPQPRPEPLPQPRPRPAPQPGPEPSAELWRDLSAAEFGPRKPKGVRRARDEDQPAADWKYPVFAFGSVLLGVVLIAAWAGAHAQDAPGADDRLPAAAVKHHAAAPAPAEAAVQRLPEVASSRPPPVERTRHPVRRERASVERLAGLDETLATPPEEQAPSDAAPTDAPATPPAVSTSLPLPNALVARTIDRIGYACGSVASATAGAQPGAYKVTCTSGQSFEAKPVHGRYRFRRL